MTGINKIDDKVLRAIEAIDRKHFVRAKDQGMAYEDHPLDIGHGQTISQPFIVALMTHALDIKSSDTILEVGSGSGYQAAILSKLARKVYGVEIVPELAERARENLAKVGIDNVRIEVGDGNLGLREHAPYDKIMVTAAAQKLPAHLLEQLKILGIMVIPKSVGAYEQMLLRIEKISEAEYRVKDLLPVRFVPLIYS